MIGSGPAPPSVYRQCGTGAGVGREDLLAAGFAETGWGKGSILRIGNAVDFVS